MEILMAGRGSGKTTRQIMVIMSEGNPGCAAFLCELHRIGHWQDASMALAEFGILGERAYKLWNDCCGRDAEKAAEILHLAKERKITQKELCNHIDLPYGKPFDIGEIRKREKQPQVYSARVEVYEDPRARGNKTREKAIMDVHYNRLMEELFRDSDDIGKRFTVDVEMEVVGGRKYLKATKREVER